MDSRLTDAQRDLDGLLPVFVTAEDPDRFVETTWINLADLALFDGESLGVRAGVRAIEGVAPSPDPRAVTVLSAGSLLRFIGTFHETWGYGYLAASHLLLSVVRGPASGMIVSLTRDDRWLVTRSVGRHTAAAALIVPPDNEIADLAAAANVRHRKLQTIVVGSHRAVDCCGAQRPNVIHLSLTANTMMPRAW